MGTCILIFLIIIFIAFFLICILSCTMLLIYLINETKEMIKNIKAEENESD